jgi:copper transport protein
VNKRPKVLIGGGAVALLLVLLMTVPALAHGELEGSDPKDGSVLNTPPKEVRIDFTETPTDAKTLKVLDGCGRNAIERAKVEGKSLVASIQDAQPGKWLAGWRIVSDEDGHVTNGSMSFRVRGTPDCSAQTKPHAQQPTADDTRSIDPKIIVLIIAGSLVIIGFALLVRRLS